MHPEYEVHVHDATDADFAEVAEELQQAMVDDVQKIMKFNRVSYSAAIRIQYLRTRSRWSQEKEDELISLAQSGKDLPDVFAGEF